MEAGGFDQTESETFFGSRPPFLPLASRPDVLPFETEPLAHDAAIIGPVSVRLWASSTAVDTDFTAKLVDVYPPSEDYPKGTPSTWPTASFAPSSEIHGSRPALWSRVRFTR